jgi:hypothetical protein
MERIPSVLRAFAVFGSRWQKRDFVLIQLHFVNARSGHTIRYHQGGGIFGAAMGPVPNVEIFV